MKPLRTTIRIAAMMAVAALGAALIAGCREKISTGQPGAIETAVNPGAQKWKFGTGGSVASPAIGADGTIYAGSADFNLYAISPDGTRK